MTDGANYSMDLVKELPARIQTQCQITFDNDEEGLYDLAQDWKKFFTPNTSKSGVKEPYLDDEKYRVSFVYQYLLFGVAASKDRLDDLIKRFEAKIPIVSSDTCNKDISIVCIGGGPGTDVFAILAAQKQLFGDCPPTLKFHIFDQAGSQWKRTLDSLLAGATPKFDYQYYDLTLPSASVFPYFEEAVTPLS